MKAPSRILSLSPAEHRLLCHYLLCYRNELIAEGKCLDVANELLAKLYKPRRCRHG